MVYPVSAGKFVKKMSLAELRIENMNYPVGKGAFELVM